MADLIIRSLDDGLAARLKVEARKRGLSLNKYMQQLLTQSMSGAPDGTAAETGRRNDLRKLAGRWTARQARDFKVAVKPFAIVEPELWK